MQADIEDVRIRVEEALSTIAVVHVPVEDADAFSLLLCHPGGEGNVVKDTEPGRLAALRVVARRSRDAVSSLVCGGKNESDSRHSR